MTRLALILACLLGGSALAMPLTAEARPGLESLMTGIHSEVARFMEVRRRGLDRLLRKHRGGIQKAEATGFLEGFMTGLDTRDLRKACEAAFNTEFQKEIAGIDELLNNQGERFRELWPEVRTLIWKEYRSYVRECWE